MATVRLHEQEIAILATSATGPVGTDLRRRGRNVQRVAKQLVGVETGRLRDSIKTSYGIGLLGPEVRVGSNLHYAYLHHEGTRPSVIRPKSGKMLRFKVGGAVVFTDEVRHPGTRANPYLRRALPAAGR